MSANVHDPSMAVAVGVPPAAPAAVAPPERLAAPVPVVAARKPRLFAGGLLLSAVGYGLVFLIPRVHSIIGQKCSVVVVIAMLLGGVGLMLGGVVRDALGGRK